MDTKHRTTLAILAAAALAAASCTPYTPQSQAAPAHAALWGGSMMPGPEGAEFAPSRRQNAGNPNTMAFFARP